MMAVAEWDALLAKGAAIRAEATQWAAAGKPARFRDHKGRPMPVTPDLDFPPDGWRVTTFGDDGQPWGHVCFYTAAEAFEHALRYGTAPGGVP